ncbi:hypothetical protein [Streptomyces sp. NPDC001068]|uniref:hypothetical protein n=1 Tax=Streptomyces sp. NPDC001068 TaxID=3364544 RepID=UPI003674CEC2
MSRNGEIVRAVPADRWEALEGSPLLLVELATADGGVELLIYDEAGQVVDASYVPPELVEDAEERPVLEVNVPRQRRS